MRILKVRDVEIGKGIPKIIAPICDKTEKEILHTAKKFSIIPVDLIRKILTKRVRGSIGV